GIYAVVIHPAGASLLFLGVLYFWHIPRYFDLTVLHDSWDDFAHVTMLVTGVWFWWMILDPRRRPGRVSFGLRLLVLGITVVPNSLLGAYLTFIHADLYTAYDQVGRWWGLSALTDQQLAGLILWIPGAMMYFIALLVVLWLWRRDELGVGATEAVKAPPAAAFSEFTASS
ncbi:MAG: cytochrome c oxidase assembly protein, partial [Gammaproteobacteria bacterium]